MEQRNGPQAYLFGGRDANGETRIAECSDEGVGTGRVEHLGTDGSMIRHPCHERKGRSGRWGQPAKREQSVSADGRTPAEDPGKAPESKVGWDLVLYDAVLFEQVKVMLEDMIGSGVLVGGGQRRPRPGRDDLLAVDRPLSRGSVKCQSSSMSGSWRVAQMGHSDDAPLRVGIEGRRAVPASAGSSRTKARFRIVQASSLGSSRSARV